MGGFLKKLGMVLAKGLGAVSGLDAIKPFIPAKFKAYVDRFESPVVDTMKDLQDLIVTIEAVGVSTGMGGPQKFAAIAPLAANVIAQSSLVAGHPVADENMYKAGVADIVNGIVKVLSSLKDKPAADSSSTN